MKHIATTLAAGSALVLLSSLASYASSQTVTGSIDISMTLIDGCLVENVSASSGVDFGTLNFGSSSTLFTQANAQVVGVNGNGISIQCSAGNDATLKIVSGANDANAGGNTHAMANAGVFIPYDIYDDPGYAPADIVNNNDTINVVGDGTVKTIALYGRAVGAAGLSAGVYQDTLTMQVDF